MPIGCKQGLEREVLPPQRRRVNHVQHCFSHSPQRLFIYQLEVVLVRVVVCLKQRMLRIMIHNSDHWNACQMAQKDMIVQEVALAIL